MERRPEPRNRACVLASESEAQSKLGSRNPGLLKRHLGKVAQLARMQPFALVRLQFFQRVEADLEMLPDTLAVELARHAGKLDLAVQRFVGDAQQRPVGHTKAK